MALREILANFGVTFDSGQLTEGAKAVDNVIGNLKGLAGAVGGAFAVGKIWHFITGATESADALLKQAESIGISFGALKQWNYAASLSNVEAETLAATLAKLSGGKGDKGLAALGISAKDATGQFKDAGVLLEDVAEALSKIDNPSERNRKAMAVLGKNYAKLMPLLKDGKKGIEEMKEEFLELGGSTSDQFAKDAEEFNDDLTRLEFTTKSLKGMVVKALLPTLMSAVKWLIRTAKVIVPLIKNSKALQTAFIVLSLRGVVLLSNKLGPLGKGLKALSRQFFTVIVPLLILEDFLVFLAGGKSVFGEIVDKAFGKGTGDKIRKWVEDVKKEFLGFIDDIAKRPGKLLEDWELFTTTLKRDIKDWGGEFGEILNVAGGMFLTFIDLLTGGWKNFGDKTEAIWDYIKLTGKIVYMELEAGFVHLAAMVGDAFGKAWNVVLDGAKSVIGLLGKARDIVGGTKGAEWAKGVMSDIDSARSSGDMGRLVEQAREMERAKIAVQYDSIAARLDGARPPDVTVGATTIQVTVPPGTPKEQANAVAKATGKVVDSRNAELRAAQAALRPGGGR